MQKTLLLATTLVAFSFVDTLAAQRGGRNRWRRPDAITNRLQVHFHDVAGPETDGDKVADLGTIELVRNAAASNQITLLYLHDTSVDEDTRLAFERMLFRYDRAGDELGMRLRCLHCGRIDVASDAALKKRYGDDLPMFVAFDEKGEELKPVVMGGYEADVKDLVSLIDRAAKGAFKPPLKTFVRKYGDVLEQLEEVLREKDAAESDKARANGDKGKIRKAEKEIEKLQKDEQKLLEEERELLETMRQPAAGPTHVGGASEFGRGRGGRGGNNGGGGNGGGGNGGGEKGGNGRGGNNGG